MMKKKRPITTFLILTGFIAVFLCPQLLFAYDVDSWLSKSSTKESYGGLEPEIRAAAAELRQLSLSEDLLLSRLEEGAKKSVPASVLQAGIRTDMEHIRQTVRSLQARNLMPSREKDATQAVEKALLLLRAGIGAGEMEAALDAAVAKAGPKGRQQPALSRAFSALGAVASAKAAYGLSENSRQTLAKYLITSELAERKFDSAIVDIAERIKGGETAEMAVSIMGKAGVRENANEKPSQPKERTKSGGNSSNESDSATGSGGSSQSSGLKAGLEAGPGQSPASSQGGSSSSGAAQGATPTPGKKKN